jgi:ankyrin repeat protein
MLLFEDMLAETTKVHATRRFAADGSTALKLAVRDNAGAAEVARLLQAALPAEADTAFAAGGAVAFETDGNATVMYAPLVGKELNGRRVYQVQGGKGGFLYWVNSEKCGPSWWLDDEEEAVEEIDGRGCGNWHVPSDAQSPELITETWKSWGKEEWQEEPSAKARLCSQEEWREGWGQAVREAAFVVACAYARDELVAALPALTQGAARVWHKAWKRGASNDAVQEMGAATVAALVGAVAAVAGGVDARDSPTGARDSDGWTALERAANGGHGRAVGALLGAGANVCLVDSSGRTPLYRAAQNGHEAVVEQLVRAGAAVDQAKSDGSTPLFVAASGGHDAVAQVLLQSGADVNKAKEDGATPLFVAGQKGYDAVVQVLLEGGADVNKAKEDGATPLLIAEVEGHDTTVQMLLRAESKNAWKAAEAEAGAKAEARKAHAKAAAGAKTTSEKAVAEKDRRHAAEAEVEAEAGMHIAAAAREAAAREAAARRMMAEREAAIRYHNEGFGGGKGGGGYGGKGGGGYGGYDGYATSNIRTKDGSRDMRYSENKGRSKYG